MLRAVKVSHGIMGAVAAVGFNESEDVVVP
jgi:tRNA(Ile2) C34 agmatinyltransferase TiaS